MNYIIKIFMVFILCYSNYSEAQIRNNAYALKGVRWEPTSIQVTWENADDDNKVEREWVRQAITETWQKESNLKFTNWGNSQANSKGIRILISDDDYGPHTKGLGNELDGLKDGMVLNFTFNHWSPVMKYKRKQYIIAIAVHEFGHALGFAHEQARTDCYFCDEKQPGGERQGNWEITTCDIKSVMNYCNPDYSNWGKLSQGDIIAVTSLYSKPIITVLNSNVMDYQVSLSHTVREMTSDELIGRENLHKLLKIYTTGSEKALNNILKVIYKLHPSFSPDILEVTNREANFGLGIFVWGMFEIKAQVIFKDGTVKNLSRYLNFDEMSQAPNANETIELSHTVKILSPSEISQSEGNTREVKLFLKASDEFIQNVSYVEYTLHPTFTPNIRSSKDLRDKFTIKFTCWGEFTVHAKIVMQNGTSYDLTHFIKL